MGGGAQLHFKCSASNGKCSKRTVASICHFQKLELCRSQKFVTFYRLVFAAKQSPFKFGQADSSPSPFGAPPPPHFGAPPPPPTDHRRKSDTLWGGSAFGASSSNKPPSGFGGFGSSANSKRCTIVVYCFARFNAHLRVLLDQKLPTFGFGAQSSSSSSAFGSPSLGRRKSEADTSSAFGYGSSGFGANNAKGYGGGGLFGGGGFRGQQYSQYSNNKPFKGWGSPQKDDAGGFSFDGVASEKKGKRCVRCVRQSRV